MKILFVTNKMPYPPIDGGSIATFSLAKSIKKLGHEVTFLAMNTSKHEIDCNEIPDNIFANYNLNVVNINTDINIIGALKNLIFSKLPYNAQRFLNKDFDKKLAEILNKNDFDIVQLEGLYLCPYIETIRKKSNAKIALRSHNIEHEIWHRTALNDKNFLKRIYLKNLALRIKKLKLKYLNKYDFLIPITDRDARRYSFFGNKKPVFVIQTGVDSDNYVPNTDKAEFPGFFHLGALDWMPNQEGLIWFLENVWQEISQKFNQYKFYIAGRNAPKSFVKLIKNYRNVEYLGEVDNAKDFINSKTVMIVPLLSGSGMRIKIIEGMALGKIIISTKVGTEGIATTHKENIIIADNGQDFINEIENLLTNKQDYCHIKNNAIKFVAENYDNKIIANSLIDFFKSNCK